MWLESVKYLGPTIVGIISIVASLIINSRIMKSKSKDCERDQIQAKINDFYGPFIQLRKKVIFYINYLLKIMKVSLEHY